MSPDMRGSDQRDDTDDFLHLFLNDAPLLDVRAPVEFAKGSFPGAVNIPLLNDEERHRVGTTYKEEGQEAAVALGHQLVSGDIKAARLAQWQDFVRQHPQGYLFCFRGGLRSHITQQWLGEAQTPYPLVKGGYKALRRFLIDTFDHLVATRKFFVISGRTGTGKTMVISQLENAVDLEALANHRGSSFGRRIAGQPSQINFENALAIKLLKVCYAGENPVFIEDESQLVGRCALPQSLLSGMRAWPIIVLEDTLENRIANVQKDYVTDMLAEHQSAYGADGFSVFAEFLQASLLRISKRLGGERYKELQALMANALVMQRETGAETLHRLWIYELLTHYYDPMYDYQLSQKESRVVFRGDRAAVLDWCRKA